MQIFVNVSNEHQRRIPTNSSQHDEEEVTDHCHVAKVKRCLQETTHVGAIDIIKYCIQINENASRSEQNKSGQ
jgi:hypothetical protein